MVPLAKALLQRGAQVGWATAPDALPELAAQGFDLFAVGLPTSMCRREYRRRWPEALSLEGEALSNHTFPRLFGGVVAPAMLSELGAAVDSWRPELVVNDAAALAGPLVCTRRRVPYVTHGYGLRPTAEQLSSAMQEFGSHWRTAGLQPPDDGGLCAHLYLDIVPVSLGTTPKMDRSRVQSMMPAATRMAANSPLPLSLRHALQSHSRPAIYLTFGTVFNRSVALRSAVDALQRLNATIIVTVGRDGDLAGFGDLPGNVHLYRHIEQGALLPLCDAVVSHGGAGSVLGAAAHGLPQLILPQGADHFRNALALTRAGAAVTLKPECLSLHAVEESARSLFGIPSLAIAAKRLALEIKSMPTVDAVADVLSENLNPRRIA